MGIKITRLPRRDGSLPLKLEYYLWGIRAILISVNRSRLHTETLSMKTGKNGDSLTPT